MRSRAKKFSSKISRIVPAILVLLSLLVWTGCTKSGGDADPVVAEFNGKKIHASQAFERIKTRLFDLEEDQRHIGHNQYLPTELPGSDQGSGGAFQGRVVQRLLTTRNSFYVALGHLHLIRAEQESSL